jgi:hypothetical protein
MQIRVHESIERNDTKLQHAQNDQSVCNSLHRIDRSSYLNDNKFDGTVPAFAMPSLGLLFVFSVFRFSHNSFKRSQQELSQWHSTFTSRHDSAHTAVKFSPVFCDDSAR